MSTVGAVPPSISTAASLPPTMETTEALLETVIAELEIDSRESDPITMESAREISATENLLVAPIPTVVLAPISVVHANALDSSTAEFGSADSSTFVSNPRSQLKSASKLYYGWWMLLLSMLLAIATSPGQTFGVSIFNEPLRIELGLTHGELALAYTLGTLIGAIPITWFGRQLDRHGIRRTTLLILVAFTAACWTVSLASRWIELVVAFTLLRMLGPGALSLMSANTLPFWFHRRLGAVEGFRQTAMAMAMAVIPGFNLWLVMAVGWRGAFVLMGLGVLALWPIFYFCFRNRPSDVGQQFDESSRKHGKGNFAPTENLAKFTLGQALRTSVFWSALANGSLYSLIHTGVFFCLVPILVEKELDASYSALMLMVFAISLAVHQMLGGWFADRVNPAIQMTVGQVLFASGLSLLLLGGGAIAILTSGLILGAAQGVFFAASNPLWARYFGLKNLGAIRGFLMSFHVALSSVGPLLVGSCHDLFGDFQYILLAFCALPLICGCCLFLVKPPLSPDLET